MWRQIAVHAGLPNDIPGQTVNRVCGSGLQAVVSAAQALKAGEGKVHLAGGTENMSMAPYLLLRARSGYRYGNGELVDAAQKDGLTDAFHNCAMGVTAENIASAWKITREEQDAFAVESQRLLRRSIRVISFIPLRSTITLPGRHGTVSP